MLNRPSCTFNTLLHPNCRKLWPKTFPSLPVWSFPSRLKQPTTNVLIQQEVWMIQMLNCYVTVWLPVMAWSPDAPYSGESWHTHLHTNTQTGVCVCVCGSGMGLGGNLRLVRGEGGERRAGGTKGANLARGIVFVNSDELIAGQSSKSKATGVKPSPVSVLANVSRQHQSKPTRGKCNRKGSQKTKNMFRRFQMMKMWLMCGGWRLSDPTSSKSVRQETGNLRPVPVSLQGTHEMRPLEMRGWGRERQRQIQRLTETFYKTHLKKVKVKKVVVLVANSVVSRD